MHIADDKYQAVITTPIAAGKIFREHKARYTSVPLIAVSGAFDPIHIGNTKCIHAASLLKGDNGLLVIIVNGDDFLLKKKGYVFMPLQERLELISHIKGVDLVVPWNDDGTMTVTGALEEIRPNIFAKGGNTTAFSTVPESDACEKMGCSVVFGIGGHKKVQSSSALVANLQKPMKVEETK